jgi:hypothetical protein
MKIKVLSLSLIIAFTACKKNNTVDGCTDSAATNYNSAATDDDGSCVLPVPPNPTCDGHTTNNSLFPLLQGTKWRYDQTGSSSDYYVEINGTTDINGVTYINADWSQFNGNITGTKNYRIDANGDVYYRSGSSDYLHVPSNPTLNQSWVDEYSVTHIVTNLNASITTNDCSYTGCLEIKNDYTSTPDTYNYYKSGIGMVKSVDYTLENLEF